jgi:hypothetical protein
MGNPIEGQPGMEGEVSPEEISQDVPQEGEVPTQQYPQQPKGGKI